MKLNGNFIVLTFGGPVKRTAFLTTELNRKLRSVEQKKWSSEGCFPKNSVARQC